MKISAQFATSLDSPEHIAIAERLGYARAWLFDTPQQSPDVWMMLALAADRTDRIGLGPAVLVPALRHPMVNAAGASALEAMAPGRTAVAFGKHSVRREVDDMAAAEQGQGAVIAMRAVHLVYHAARPRQSIHPVRGGLAGPLRIYVANAISHRGRYLGAPTLAQDARRPR